MALSSRDGKHELTELLLRVVKTLKGPLPAFVIENVFSEVSVRIVGYYLAPKRLSWQVFGNLADLPFATDAIEDGPHCELGQAFASMFSHDEKLCHPNVVLRQAYQIVHEGKPHGVSTQEKYERFAFRIYPVLVDTTPKQTVAV